MAGGGSPGRASLIVEMAELWELLDDEQAA